VTASAGADQDQAVDTVLDRLFGVADVGDIVQHDAAVAVHRIDHAFVVLQTGDDDRHLMFDQHLGIGHQAVVGGVADLVDRERRDFFIGIGGLIVGQFAFDADDPLVEQRGGACVQRRERADDAGLALRDHQLGRRHDKHRRRDDGENQAIFQGGRYAHD